MLGHARGTRSARNRGRWRAGLRGHSLQRYLAQAGVGLQARRADRALPVAGTADRGAAAGAGGGPRAALAGAGPAPSLAAMEPRLQPGGAARAGIGPHGQGRGVGGGSGPASAHTQSRRPRARGEGAGADRCDQARFPACAPACRTRRGADRRCADQRRHKPGLHCRDFCGKPGLDHGRLLRAGGRRALRGLALKNITPEAF